MELDNKSKLYNHEKLLKKDFAKLNYPIKNWVPKTLGPNKKPLIDVLVVGGGMNGLAAAFALRAQGIQNIRQVDQQSSGYTGPWLNFARMEYLRSPKHLTGPTLNIPNLTYRSWWEAVNSGHSWEDVGFIKREDWASYLRWFGKVTSSKIEHNSKVTNIEIGSTVKTTNFDPVSYYCVDLTKADNSLKSNDKKTINRIYTRYIVLANGREGLAQPRIPKVLKTLASKKVFHSSSKINFASFKGKTVVVVGVAASALDNAACAAEAGATVIVVARSPQMPLLNKMRQTVYPGFAEGFYLLSDTEKLDWITHIQNQRIAPPKHTVERVAKLNIRLILDSEIESASETKTNLKLTILSSKVKTVTYADFIILGTGFVVDLNQVPELKKLSKDILLWGDVLKGHLNGNTATSELLSFPYLGKNFQFKSIDPSKNKILGNIRCFNHAAQLSLGNLANDIPHSNEGAQRLAKSIAADLFEEDKKVHFERLKNYTELEINGSEWSEIPD